MFVSFPWWSLALLVAPIGPVPVVRPLPPSAVPVFAVDSVPTPPLLPLTDTLLEHYIALQHDLAVFWQTHSALRATAQQREVEHRLRWCRAKVGIYYEFHNFDYVALTAQDPTLAAVFTRHHMAPEQFVPIVDAVSSGLALLDDVRRFGLTLDPARLLDKNAELVAHHPALGHLDFHAVGITSKERNAGC